MTESQAAARPTWRIAVDAPLGPLHYLIPETWQEEQLQRGRSVLVPLGRRQVSGVLLAQDTSPPPGMKLKEALGFIEDRPVLPARYLDWIEWLSRYYAHPLGQILEMVFPPLPKGGGRRKSRKTPLVQSLMQQSEGGVQRIDHSVNLTAEQTAIVDAIESKPGFAAHLLYGVTGSGKTEVYMELIARCIADNASGAPGGQALVLVPEIALTPQLIERFARRFGDQIAVIHSHLTPREKTDNWWAAADGTKPVLIGARSALFCPLPRLKLIVIDEEHEPSFKQDDSLRYHARDAAIMLAKLGAHAIVLGSATPSLESWQNATSGRFQLHRLPSRIGKAQLPAIEVVDLRETRDSERQAGGREDGRPFWLSKPLQDALAETLERGEQAALFLNRRGIAQSVVCPSCGHSPECPNCEVALTLHGRSDLLCHYCDYHETKREVCGECQHGEPKALGLGTELIERDLARIFPAARTVRMDRDEIQNREDLEEALRKVEAREVDILIGTQMIAKGLDFPGLTLVGLVMADIAFNLPDFRASERAFQLLTQVAGRAGRHLVDRAGRVILQTYNPDHPSIQFTLAHDFEGFAAHEMQFREPLGYPPCGRLAAIKIAGPDFRETEAAARRLAEFARKLTPGSTLEQAPGEIGVLGPAPAPMPKLRGLYRFQILLKGRGAQAPVAGFCRTLVQRLAEQSLRQPGFIPPKVKFNVDVDALNLL